MQNRCNPRSKTMAEVNRPASVCEPLEPRLLMRHSRVGWGAIPISIRQDQAAAIYPTLTGAGESIAVIDTGIDYTQPSLGGTTGRRSKVITGWNFIDNNSDYRDTDGHGTAVASLIGANSFSYGGQRYQGIAPGANLIALKVDNGVDDPTDANIRAAFQWVLTNRVRFNIVAINISEGGNQVFSGKTNGAGYGDLLRQLAADGVFIAAAAGNDGSSNGVEYPAADPSVASVASVDVNGYISDFSDTGPGLDLLAPGENVVVATLNGGYTTSSGTSFCAPIAAATAALVHQANPTFSSAQILQDMQLSGINDNDPSNGMTFERLDVLNALDRALHPTATRHTRTRVI